MITQESIPKWPHPKYGVHTAVLRDPEDDFEQRYWDLLLPLVNRQWRRSNIGMKYPETHFCALEEPKTMSEGFGAVPAVVLRSTPDANWAGLEMFLKNNWCEVFVSEDNTIAIVSPFYEWGLADFWEQDLYEK